MAIFVVLGLLGLWLCWQLGPSAWHFYRWKQQLPACRETLLNQADLSTDAALPLTACIRSTTTLLTTIQKSWLLSRGVSALVSYQTGVPAATVKTWLTHAPTDLSTFHQNVLTGNRNYVVLLQNSDELRATGGFPGTFAEVRLAHGQVENIKVFDIFAPSGQLQNQREAPPGVKEYLSGGSHWNLPDANWYPDFPTSAQTVMSFLGESGWQNLDGVIAINTSYIKSILDVVGPIWLPDYQLTVTSENIIESARADRESFFPGSYQKPQFLQTLSTYLRLKLSTLSTDQLKQITLITIKAFAAKDIQIYSRQPELQNVFQHFNVAGHWDPPTSAQGQPPFAFGWVESNVGINKANRGIDRSLKIAKTDTTLTVTATFTNTNPPQLVSDNPASNAGTYSRTGHYIDYQRVWVPDTLQVKSILVSDQPLEKWDEQIITTANGQKIKQIGWVLTVAEQSQLTTSITMTDPTGLSFEAPQLWLWKQPGTPPTTYFISSTDQTTQLELVRDQVITW